MLFRRLVFWPFTVMWGAVLYVRHALYDLGILESVRPKVPTIAIGNLALGGTGKTPLLELLLRTLSATSPIATLSRGYGRESKGFREVQASDTSTVSGDEPLQIKRKFPEARVFVGTDRAAAIDAIQRIVPGVQAVLLDDALQHRRLNAGLNILLTTWARPYCDDALIPAGTLRDLRSRASAAQLVVVTKSPGLPTPLEQQIWRKRLRLRPAQSLFFSGVEYEGALAPVIHGHSSTNLVAGGGKKQDVFISTDRTGQTPGPHEDGPHLSGNCLVFTGIADPEPLLMHVRSFGGQVDHVAFPDHHPFTPSDLQALAARYAIFAAGPKTLVTTEKDAARLSGSLVGSPIEGLPLLVVGMRAIILNEPERFADLIRHHVESHTAHR